MTEPIIKVRGLHKYFGPLHVIKGVDLDVTPGEVVVIIGPSGGGKSTFLRCLNFLEEPSAGTIEIDGVVIDAREPSSRHRGQIRELRKRAGMVFQQFNLFPHMTAIQNIIEAPATVKRWSRDTAAAKGEELLRLGGPLRQERRIPLPALGRAAAAGGHRKGACHGTQDHAL